MHLRRRRNGHGDLTQQGAGDVTDVGFRSLHDPTPADRAQRRSGRFFREAPLARFALAALLLRTALAFFFAVFAFVALRFFFLGGMPRVYHEEGDNQ